MSDNSPVNPFAVGPYVIGGVDQGVLFDDSGTLAEDPAFTWDKNEKVLTVAEPTRATIDVLRGSTPHPAWNYANHLVFIAGQESTGGGTICATAHAHNDPSTSPEFTGYRSRGTLANPTPVVNGDRLMRYAAVCWDGAAFGAGGMADFYAAENWAPNRHGTYFVVRLVERGTHADRPALVLDDRGVLRLPLSAARVQIGVNAATTGAIGIENNAAISAKTVAGQETPLMVLDRTDTITIGDNNRPVNLTPPNKGLRIDNQVDGKGSKSATLKNAPVTGNPRFWMPINIGGTVRYFPCW